MQGRKPLPLNVKLMRGHPGHHPLNLDEPKVEFVNGIPKRPSWLKTKDSRAEWEIQLAYLTKNCVLGENELSLLADYCYLHGEFVEVARTGKIMNAAMIAQMRALRTELGIGPSARSRLKSGINEAKNDEEKRFFG